MMVLAWGFVAEEGTLITVVGTGGSEAGDGGEGSEGDDRSKSLGFRDGSPLKVGMHDYRGKFS